MYTVVSFIRNREKNNQMHTKMKKRLFSRITIVLGVFALLNFGFSVPNQGFSEKALVTQPAISSFAEKVFLYDKLDLASLGLSKQAFTYALTGFSHLINDGKIIKENILSILDFSLPSGKKRLFVIDLTEERLVFNTYASHGKNSGKIIPTDFSNQNNSNKTSLGFYITGDIYQGKNGYSLRLEGEEENINSNASARGIVMHGAAYVNEQLASAQGFIGRSQGCPALPKKLSRNIIDRIKNGSCLFIYSPDKYYITHSKMIQDFQS